MRPLTNILRRRNKDGTLRRYHRVTGVRLPDAPEHQPEFIVAWAREEEAAKRHKPKRSRHGAGTLGAAIEAYQKGRDWRELADSTKAMRRRILSKIGDRGGHVRLSSIRPHHIIHDIEDCPAHAARDRLKAWRAVMKHAGLEAVAKAVALPEAPRSDGHHTWTRDEIAAYRKHHKIGTDARLAFELAYWTAARSSDLVRLGRQSVQSDGWLRFVQKKTGVEVEIPFTCVLPADMAGLLSADHVQLLACIDAMPRGRLLFLETAQGKPRSEKAFGSWLATHAQAAGLAAGRTPHGLRKARLTMMAEAGWSELKRMAWAGHLDHKEAHLYTKKAERKAALRGTERDRNTGTPHPTERNAEEK